MASTIKDDGVVPRERRRDELTKISRRSAQRPVRDERSADEILGYGADGGEPGESSPLIAIEHPVASFLAFVDSDFDEQHVEELRVLAGDLAATRDDWVLGAPRFVDETDDYGRTVGILLRVYAAFDEAGALLDEALDRKHLEEVRALIAGLRMVTAHAGIDVGLELDGDSVGWVEQGEMTEDLRVGLLEAWASRFA